MQMVCIISCNNPGLAAPRRLNSSNRASKQAHLQWLRSPLAGLSPGPPSSPSPMQGGPSTHHQEMLWDVGGFAAGGDMPPPDVTEPPQGC